MEQLSRIPKAVLTNFGTGSEVGCDGAGVRALGRSDDSMPRRIPVYTIAVDGVIKIKYDLCLTRSNNS